MPGRILRILRPHASQYALIGCASSKILLSLEPQCPWFGENHHVAVQPDVLLRLYRLLGRQQCQHLVGVVLPRKLAIGSLFNQLDVHFAEGLPRRTCECGPAPWPNGDNRGCAERSAILAQTFCKPDNLRLQGATFNAADDHGRVHAQSPLADLALLIPVSQYTSLAPALDLRSVSIGNELRMLFGKSDPVVTRSSTGGDRLGLL